MLSTQTLKNAARPLQWIATIAQFVLGPVKRAAIAIVHRRHIEVLARFDDRMLADIGLTRNDLRFVFGEPFWRDPFPLLARYAGERRTEWRRPASNDPSRVTPAPSIVGLEVTMRLTGRMDMGASLGAAILRGMLADR